MNLTRETNLVIADQILSFFKSLQPPTQLPNDIGVLNPYHSEEAWSCTETFYKKYFNDQHQRKILLGINPGRLGGGLTGIPFTDPICLDQHVNLENPFKKKSELSSTFIYEMIKAYGGPKHFYSKYFISGISPLGFIQDNKNVNYYDIKNWKEIFKDSIVHWMKEHLKFNIDRSIAYSIGKGENMKLLKKLNDEHHFFEKIEPLPHPRWVMQYRLKSKETYIKEYLQKLS